MPQRNEFSSSAIDLRAYAELKRGNALRDEAIRIDEIWAANRKIVFDYPNLAAWYCVSVRQRSERTVENAFDAAGIIAKVPRFKGDPIRKRGRIIAQPMLPVIPGYILVQCVPSPYAFKGIRRVEGVIAIIGKGEVPYRLSTKKIERFIDLADGGGYDVRPVECRFAVGERVTVIEGPFASFGAEVVGMDLAASHGRINVEVHIFGRSARVEMDIAQIEKL